MSIRARMGPIDSGVDNRIMRGVSGDVYQRVDACVFEGPDNSVLWNIFARVEDRAFEEINR
jgi:hypothetical protein